MTKHFCDRCGVDVTNAGADKHDVTPGHVGTKLICKSCWEMWIETVNRFFAKQ